MPIDISFSYISSEIGLIEVIPRLQLLEHFLRFNGKLS
jgi:hypothetical protein